MNYFVKITLVCSLTLCNLLCNASTDTEIIHKTEMYDLDLSGENKQLLSEVIQTITHAGKIFVDPFLAKPTDSIEVLYQRQRVIQFLLETNLYPIVKEQLHTLTAHEAALPLEMSGPLSEHALKKVYFSLESLQKYNTSPYALDLGYAMHITGLCLPLIEYLLLHSGINFIARAHDHKATTETVDDHHETEQACNDDHCTGHDHAHEEHHHAVPEKQHAPKKLTCCDADLGPDASKLALYSFQAAILAAHISPLYHMVEDVHNRSAMIKHLQEQMIHIAAYIKTAQEMFDIIKQYPIEELNFKPFNELAYFFAENPACSADAQQLLRLLKEPTFTGNASLVNHIGNVLAAYKLYKQTYQEFHKLTQALGEIDAYAAIADTFKQQTVEDPWCFVQYRTSPYARIMAKNMRHLFIPAAQSKNWHVDNSTILHTFITGENGSGKSTYINGLGHALILAQTFGIAPAQEFEITPFSHICTYRFIEDNIAAGTSRFYAECARIEEILSIVTESSKLSCVLLDEPFTSTNAQKGSNFLEVALSKLYEKNNVISFTASHYGALKALATEHKKTRHLHLR